MCDGSDFRAKYCGRFFSGESHQKLSEVQGQEIFTPRFCPT